MAIARIASADLGLDPSGAGLNYTVGGAATFLALGFFGDVGADVLTDVKYAGVSKTGVATAQGSGDRRIWLAYWTSPTTGSNAFSFTWSSTPGHTDLACADYSGTSAFVDFDSGTSTGANITLSALVAGASTDWGFAVHREFAGTSTTWTGMTELRASNGLHIADTNGQVGASGAYNVVANSGGNASALIGVLFSASGGGATRGLFRTPSLSGVGGGGSFFRDPLQAAPYARRNHIYVPARMAA